jgi:hypothetical protein
MQPSPCAIARFLANNIIYAINFRVSSAAEGPTLKAVILSRLFPPFPREDRRLAFMKYSDNPRCSTIKAAKRHLSVKGKAMSGNSANCDVACRANCQVLLNASVKIAGGRWLARKRHSLLPLQTWIIDLKGPARTRGSRKDR